MGACLCKDELAESIPRGPPVDCTALTASKSPIICLIGGPGAGKQTMGKRLAGKYGLLPVFVSDALRREVNSGSERGECIKRIMKEGRNLPADVVVRKVEELMARAPNASGYLLVGFPRDKSQCTLFDREVRRPNLCVYLWARKQIIEERMRSRAIAHERFDDAEEIIAPRIKTFFHSVGGVVGSYNRMIAFVDAEKSDEEVFQLTCNAVEKISSTLRSNPQAAVN